MHLSKAIEKLEAKYPEYYFIDSYGMSAAFFNVPLFSTDVRKFQILFRHNPKMLGSFGPPSIVLKTLFRIILTIGRQWT